MFNIKKRIQSFGFAFKGISTLLRTQENAKIHVIAMIAVVMAGYMLGLSVTEWLFIVFACSLVLAAEAFNTAIEFIVDLVSPDYHPLAGKAKDVAAAAVLIIASGVAIAGLIIFIPKIWLFFQK